MKTDDLLEQKLWSVSRDNPLDRETCNRIINYLLARLSEYLQQRLELVGDNWLDGDAFSATIRGAIAQQEPFRITFVGTLGMETIGDKRIPHVSTSLFLFGDHHRLTAGQPNRSFIELSYERNDSNIGQWRSLGWLTDDYEEFEDIEEDSYFYKAS